MSQEWALSTKKAALDKALPVVKEGDLSAPLNTDEPTPGRLCLILGSSIQERHGQSGESPAKCHKGDEGTGPSLL